jgi:hypothetical protein
VARVDVTAERGSFRRSVRRTPFMRARARDRARFLQGLILGSFLCTTSTKVLVLYAYG